MRLRTLAARAGWGVADQVVSSATNFALSVSVARTSSTEAFGAFALVFWVYLLFLNASRAIGSQPLIVTASTVDHARWKRAVEASTGSAAALGLAGALGIGVVALLVGEIGRSALVLAIALPGLLIQDAYRFGLVAIGRPRAAFVSDTIWALVMIGLFAWLVTSGTSMSAAISVAVWGIGAAVGALAAGLAARAIPRPTRLRAWVGDHRTLIPGFLIGSLADTFIQTATQFTLAALAGLTVVAAIRAGQLVLSPVIVLYQGILFVAGPESRRLLENAPARLPRRLAALGGGLAGLAVMAGIVALLLPTWLGQAIVGASWSIALPILPPLIVATAFQVSSGGASTGLLVMGAAMTAARLSIWTSLVAGALVIVGGVTNGAFGAAVGAASRIRRSPPAPSGADS